MAIYLKEIDPDTLYDPTETKYFLKVASGTLANRRTRGQSPEYVKLCGRIWYPGKKILDHLAGRST